MYTNGGHCVNNVLMMSFHLPMMSFPLQAYCAEMVCFDYHQHCKGGPQSRLALCSVLLPLAQDFLAAHGFFQASSGHTER